MLKETYYSVKRDLLQCQKRPRVSKETYYSVKRDVHVYVLQMLLKSQRLIMCVDYSLVHTKLNRLVLKARG